MNRRVNFQNKCPHYEGIRAKDEIRTRDPDLGKVVLYQLSYFRINVLPFVFGDANIARFVTLARTFV